MYSYSKKIDHAGGGGGERKGEKVISTVLLFTCLPAIILLYSDIYATKALRDKGALRVVCVWPPIL